MGVQLHWHGSAVQPLEITMKFLLLICLVDLASAKYTENLKQFDEEMGIVENAPEEVEKMEEELLEKTEKEINENNEKFAKGESSFQEKLTEFADMTDDELKEHEGAIAPDMDMRGLGLVLPPAEERISSPNLDEMYAELDRQTIPAAYNSITEGLVTSPKNQGACGSCAAFAATGLHETSMVKAGATLSGLDLSEQYLVDCAYSTNGANGCNGAWPHIYSKWFHEDGGVGLHETGYPYLGRNPKLNCDTAGSLPKWSSGAKVSNAQWDYSCTEDKLKQLVATKGAVAVAIYASDSGFGSYKSGVFDQCTDTTINHAVLAVGYGTENGKDYWLVKNSWGTNWGDGGYIKMLRGSNHCRIGNICTWTDSTKTGEQGVVPTAAPSGPVVRCLQAVRKERPHRQLQPPRLEVRGRQVEVHPVPGQVREFEVHPQAGWPHQRVHVHLRQDHLLTTN